MPFAKVENCCAVLNADAERAKRRGGIAAGQLADFPWIRRYHQPLTVLGDGCDPLSVLGLDMLDRFGLAVEQHFEETASEQAGR